MTNEKLTNRQAIGVLDGLWSNPLFSEHHRQAFEIGIKAIKALEQELIFEEIKAEALSLKINYTDFDRDAYRRGINDVLKIIDKYKTEIEPQESAYDKCPICVNRNKNCQFGSLDCHFEKQIDVAESEE